MVACSQRSGGKKIISIIMIRSSSQRGAALMGCRLRQFLLLSGITSMLPTIMTHAFSFAATTNHCNNNNHLLPSLRPAIIYRTVHLPKRKSFRLSSSSSDDEQSSTTHNNSVTGPIYEMTSEGSNNPLPKIKLFTKEGCTLCDTVKQTLSEIKNDYPHSLYAVDITDEDKVVWFEKYKYDIPVLHMEDVYWTKHRLSKEEAIQGIEDVMDGKFEEGKGEPDAGRLEH